MEQENKQIPFTFTLLDGTPFYLRDDGTSVTLVVNTASKCGFARQFKALQMLHDRYHKQGLIVLGVSAQNFGQQELDSACDIADSIQHKAGKVTFPITQLTSVRGKTAHPFYAWAAKQVSVLGRPKWNFHKYLIGRDGRLIDWFASATDPLHPRLIAAIEKELGLEQHQSQL